MDNDENYGGDARKQWSESYVFRTINISKLLGQAMGEFGGMLEEGGQAKKQDHVEISCPLFLRPLMKQILSVGKTIKIVRYLEQSFKKTQKVEELVPTVDLSRYYMESVTKYRNAVNKHQTCLDFMAKSKETPNFAVECIARQISHDT